MGALGVSAMMHGYLALDADGQLLTPFRTWCNTNTGEAAERILQLPDRPTAVLAANDLEALGVVEAARRLSLAVPGDLSVVGFDDSVLATTASPPLTTVRQPLVEMAAAAARLVLALAKGDKPDQTRIELVTSLIIRQSTGPVGA